MRPFGEAEDMVARAEGLGEQLAIGWEAFHFIVTVADHYSGFTSGLFAMWMYAISPACEGRDYLGLAPAIRQDLAGHIEAPDLNDVGEEEAADGLAAIAETLAKKLKDMAQATPDPVSAKVCVHAAESAAEIRGLLAVGG